MICIVVSRVSLFRYVGVGRMEAGFVGENLKVAEVWYDTWYHTHHSRMAVPVYTLQYVYIGCLFVFASFFYHFV